jgi:guanylate kinase
MLFVVTGPSGSGKSTLIRRLLASTPALRFSVSHTTRPRRGSERNGREYRFVTRRAFERLAAAGRFLEWAEVHGHLYGTGKQELVGRGDIVLDIDVQGARQVRAALEPGKAVFVFVAPPSAVELRRRIEARGENGPGEIARRLAAAGVEMRAFPEFDYVVINRDLDAAAAELAAVVVAARCRTSVRKRRLAAISRSFGS